MQFNKILQLGFVTLIASFLLVGCQDEEKKDSTKETKQAQQSLTEQGYSYKKIESFDNDINVLYLEKDGKEYIATVNNDFELLMEPTDKYEDNINFYDGIARVSTDGKLYGYIDATGKEVSKAQYARADSFSDGLAVVQTADSSKWITIDTSGNEVFEIEPASTGDASEKQFDKFYEGYAYTHNGFYTKEGKFIPVDVDEENYIVINDKIYQNKTSAEDAEWYGANTEIIVKDLNGKVIDSYKTNGDMIYINSILSVRNNEIKYLNESNTLLARGIHGKTLIDASTMKVIIEDFRTDLAAGLLYKEEVADPDNSLITGSFYDYSGKKVYSVKEMAIPNLYKDRYFVKSNGYYKLIDTQGNVLIDEDKKITSVSFSNYDVEKGETGPKKLAKVEYENETGAEEEALLNLDTLEMIDISNL